MSKTIELLEKIGSDASLQSSESIQREINSSELDKELKDALINSDILSIEKKLNVREEICMVVLPAEDDEPEQENEEEKSTESKLIVNV